MNKTYSNYAQLPGGRTSERVIPGCMILEGGAWRALYTQGVLDALMEADLTMETTIGVSAGAMSALAYVSGQIGLSARVNLGHRHDPQYCGLPAFVKDRTTTGFTYFFNTLLPSQNFDWERLNRTDRRLFISATNCRTGKAEYHEKGKCDVPEAVRASASLPYVSVMVKLNGEEYLDGGCAERIPYDFALERGYRKIVVLRTRDRNYRKTPKDTTVLDRIRYPGHPELRRALEHTATEYNETIERIEKDEAAGRVFVIAPEAPITIGRFEPDVEVLGQLYRTGYDQGKRIAPDLARYLEAD